MFRPAGYSVLRVAARFAQWVQKMTRRSASLLPAGRPDATLPGSEELVLSLVLKKRVLMDAGGTGWWLRRGVRLTLAIFLGAGALVMTAAEPAAALQIEITGGGADRLERQRSWGRGDLPLAGTPDLGKLAERISEAGLKEGAAVFLRIFKAESELELWMMKGKDYKLFAIYPICQWSGVLGPKFYEGDNQSPEGFYVVGRRDLKWQTRHHRAFKIGFPNSFDKLHGRTGSNILVHGGCSTEGCFAMTNPVIDEVFRLANAAVASGQKEIQIALCRCLMRGLQTLRMHNNRSAIGHRAAI